MIDKTLKYRITAHYALGLAGKKQWAYKIAPTRGGDSVAESTNIYQTQAAAKAAGLEKMEELGLSRDMRGTGSKAKVGRKAGAEPLKTVTLHVPVSLLDFATQAGLNKSQIFADALRYEFAKHRINNPVVASTSADEAVIIANQLAAKSKKTTAKKH